MPIVAYSHAREQPRLKCDLLIIKSFFAGDPQKFERYNVITDCWESRTPLSQSRFFAQLATVNKYLYLLGGATVDSCGCTYGVAIIEFYCPMSDTWTTLESTLTPRAEGGCAVLDNKIYIVGGFNWDVKERLKTAEVYDVDMDTVQTIGDITVPLTGIACCATTICDLSDKKSREQTDVGKSFNTYDFYHHCSQSPCSLASTSETDNIENLHQQKAETSTKSTLPEKNTTQANCSHAKEQKKKSKTQENCGKNSKVKKKKSSTQSIIMPRKPPRSKYAQRYRLTRAVSCEPPIRKRRNNPETTTLKLPALVPEAKAMRE